MEKFMNFITKFWDYLTKPTQEAIDEDRAMMSIFPQPVNDEEISEEEWEALQNFLGRNEIINNMEKNGFKSLAQYARESQEKGISPIQIQRCIGDRNGKSWS